MATNFYKTLAEGKTSETTIIGFLENRGWNITDVSLDKEYQKDDIDIIAERDGCRRTIEIKRDNRIADTGNILLETITNADRHTKGWFEITKAEFIAIHDTKNNVLLIMATSHLREFVKEHRKEARYKYFKCWEGEHYKNSEAWLVPLETFKKYYAIWQFDLGGKNNDDF